MKAPLVHHRILAALLMGGMVATASFSFDANAQAAGNRESRRAKSSETKAKAEPNYPAATRTEPERKSSPRLSKKLSKMIDGFNDAKFDVALPIAEEILADEKANGYERSLAAQLAGQIKYEQDDTDAAIALFEQSLSHNGLDNNGHFGVMKMIAQLQLQESDYAKGLASLERFLSESGSTKPDDLALKATAFYYLERYKDAIAVLEPLVQASAEPKEQWLQMLMASYFEAEMPAQAISAAERLAAKNPADKRAQMNLAAAYLQGEKYDQAAAVMEKLRSAGQLTEEKDYRQLYSVYLNSEGKERQAASVIEEGLQKGILKGDGDTYTMLAQSYYFSDQVGKAIEAYGKAGPVAANGEPYLNLARLLWQEDRIAEAKDAARKAQAKGVKDDKDIKRILAL
ncbi:tetratricopeptide repeat protein [Thermomonas brevis]